LIIAGRALEDLRGSLFNEFRSPEGAKRQEHRTCGPAAALAFNFVVAISIIFMNKMVCSLFFLSGWTVLCVEVSNNMVLDFDFLDFSFQVLQTVKFKFPILLSLIHYAVSWLLMAVLNVFSLLPASPSSKSTKLSALFTLGFVMSLSTGLANVSLKYNRYTTMYDIFI